jgi:excisionase family DNA binding protein
MDSSNNIIMSNWQQGRKEPIRLLLSTREAAQALSVCEKTLWTLTKNGEIPVIRMGRSVRYPLDGLRKWISEKSA